MLIQKKLLEQLISLASDSVEYLNDKWITIHPKGHEKGQPLLIKDGETPKQAIDRKFGKGDADKEIKELIEKHKLYVQGSNLSSKDAKNIKPNEMAKIKENKEKIINYFKKEKEQKAKQEEKKLQESLKNITYTINSDRGNNGFSEFNVEQLIGMGKYSDSEIIFVTKKLNEDLKEIALKNYTPDKRPTAGLSKVSEEDYEKAVKEKTFEGTANIKREDIEKKLPDILASLKSLKEKQKLTDDAYEKHRQLVEKTMNV
jgi:hypothetical protein